MRGVKLKGYDRVTGGKNGTTITNLWDKMNDTKYFELLNKYTIVMKKRIFLLFCVKLLPNGFLG